MQEKQKELQCQIVNKENNSKRYITNKNKLWKYCCTYDMNKSHDPKACKKEYRISENKEEATYFNQIGGRKKGTFRK